MDIVWIGAVLALWAVLAAMVIGLEKLDASPPANAANSAAQGEAS